MTNLIVLSSFDNLSNAYLLQQYIVKVWEKPTALFIEKQSILEYWQYYFFNRTVIIICIRHLFHFPLSYVQSSNRKGCFSFLSFFEGKRAFFLFLESWETERGLRSGRGSTSINNVQPEPSGAEPSPAQPHHGPARTAPSTDGPEIARISRHTHPPASPQSSSFPALRKLNSAVSPLLLVASYLGFSAPPPSGSF